VIWKLLKWFAGILLGLILIVFSALAGFLWWGERHENPPEMRADPVFIRSLQPHKIELINDGLASLQRRIELIESAKQSIELEFFIYELDTAARIVTAKLIDAAKRGVKVKLLVDFSAPVFKLRPKYARGLEERGIEVRYYNTASLLRFVSSQHRSHRKLLIVDGKSAITGGRNIGDDYFNLSTHYNFLDSDLWLEGPVVESMRVSFMHYWDSDLASRSSEFPDDKEGFDERFHITDPELTEKIARVRAIAGIESKAPIQHTCNDVVFATDYIGKSAFNRQVFRRLAEFLGEARSELVGESPYFILRKDGIELLNQLSQRGVTQTFLTNSLLSTDAWYTVSALSLSLSAMEKANIDLRVYNGSRPEPSALTVNESSDRWGVHAKRAVVDRKHIVIGTYNVDPRSANFNSELMLICRDNPELAEEMLADINNRISRSRKLFESGSSPLDRLLEGSASDQRIKFALAIPLVWFFDFLL
jgi:putative cardiolipin synthase